ncbi:MAG: hypothetical protein ACYC3S_09400 [Chloroflexota bacterium]
MPRQEKTRAKPASRPGATPLEARAFVDRALAVLAVTVEASLDAVQALTTEAAALPTSALRPALAQVARQARARAVPLLVAIAEGGTPDRAEAAVDALGELRIPLAAEALAAFAREDRPHDVRKAARRALFRLRAGGVAVAGVETTAAEALLVAVTTLARVSNVDGAGNRLVVLGTEASLGAITLVVMIINDERGIVDGYGGRHARAEVPVRLASLTGPMVGLHLVDAPADYCRQAILDAHALNRASLSPVPAEYYRWEEAIGRPEQRYQREPIYDEVDPAAVRWNPQFLEESGHLLELPEFRGWLLPEDAAQEAARNVSRVRESRLVLPGRGQEDQERKLIDRFVEAYFVDALRERYKQRLERTAYVLQRLGHTIDARRAVAAALALDPRSTTSLARQPFPIGMAAATLALLEQQDLQQRERPGGLLLPPR